MGKLYLAHDLNRIPISDSPHCRDEITEAVEREQRGALKGRDEERAGEMGPMMLDVVKPGAQTPLRNAQLPCEFVFQIANPSCVSKMDLNLPKDSAAISVLQFVLCYRGHCFLPVSQRHLLRGSRRCKKDFLVQMCRRIARDADMLNLLDANTCHFQTVTNRLGGKPRAVLQSIETFLFNCSDYSAIFYDGSRSVAVISVDTKYVHEIWWVLDEADYGSRDLEFCAFRFELWR